MKARRLSDSSRRKPGRASANLAQARHACLGKKISAHHCSRVQQPSIRYNQHSSIFQAITTTPKHLKHETKLK